MRFSSVSPVTRLAVATTVALALSAQAASGASPDVNEKLAKAKAPVSQLVLTGVRTSFGARFLHYEQHVAGIPVLGADVVVTDAPGRGGDLSIDATRARVAHPGSPSVSRGAAVALARAALPGAAASGPAGARLMIAPEGGRSRLVWRVVTTSAAGDYQVLVDARSGDVADVRELAHHATGTANVFDPNPVKTRRSRSGLSDSGDADSALLTQLRRPVQLARLSDDSTCLTGRWVHAFLPAVPPREGAEADQPGGTGSGTREVCDPGRDFTAVTRSDDRFEAVMAYFHIDRAQSYIQSLGFSRARRNGLVDRQIQVKVNFINEDNSFFSTQSRDLTMGTGGVDDGEDAEVFVHEYGHAVVENASRSYSLAGLGENEQAGAIEEGFGDYFAVSIGERFRPSRGFRAGCFAAWDAQGEPGAELCLRVVDSPLTRRQRERSPECQEDYLHCAGMAWSGALWEIRGRLGAPRTDRMLLQSLFSYGAGTKFNGASRALIAANRRLSRGRDERFIRSVLCRRELMSGCTAQRRPGPRFTG